MNQSMPTSSENPQMTKLWSEHKTFVEQFVEPLCQTHRESLKLVERTLYLYKFIDCGIFATLKKMPCTVPACLVFPFLAMWRAAVEAVSLESQRCTVILVSRFTTFCTFCLLLRASHQPTAHCTAPVHPHRANYTFAFLISFTFTLHFPSSKACKDKSSAIGVTHSSLHAVALVCQFIDSPILSFKAIVSNLFSIFLRYYVFCMEHGGQ